MTKKKETRCWPGYEPVKGKRQHSEGSCKPKAESKTTPSEKAFRAERKRQLDKWQEEHPKTRRAAAQHLKSPTAAKKKAAKKVAKKAPAKRAAAAKRTR
jgi:DNA-binding protein HU-beta